MSKAKVTKKTDKRLACTSVLLPEPVNFSDVQIKGNEEFNRKYAVPGHSIDQVRTLVHDYETVINSIQAELDAILDRLQCQIKINEALFSEVRRLNKSMYIIIASGPDDTYAAGVARAAIKGEGP